MKVLTVGVLALCCTGGGGSGGPRTVAEGSARPAPQGAGPAALPPPLVYVRPGIPLRLVRRDPESAQENVLYTGLQQAVGLQVPESFGFLPSPDGTWLVVWQTRFDDRSGRRLGTLWSLVSAIDGSRCDLGEVAGEAQLLPYWHSDAEVTLEGDITTKGDAECVNFDIRSHTPTGSIQLSGAATSVPGTADWWIARTRLELYAQRHYLRLLRRLPQAREATSKFRGLWASALEGREPDEYPLLRSLGIPGLRQLRPTGRGWLYPDIAFSPAADQVALAWVSQEVDTSPGGVYARVDVVDVESHRASPVLKVRWKGQRPDPELQIVPLVPELIQPHARDLRWSRDGRFLSFTLYDDVRDGVPAPSVRVVGTSDWKEIVSIRGAMDAFVVPPRGE